MIFIEKFAKEYSFYVYIFLILLILSLYICWIGMYSYENEYLLMFLLILLGILYAIALVLDLTNHPLSALCTIILSMATIISIAATTKMKQKDGSQGSGFLCLGITPIILGVCFCSLIGLINFGSKV